MSDTYHPLACATCGEALGARRDAVMHLAEHHTTFAELWDHSTDRPDRAEHVREHLAAAIKAYRQAAGLGPPSGLIDRRIRRLTAVLERLS